MNRDDVLAQLAPWRREHERPAWRPIADEGDGAGGLSRFGGLPWLAQGEPWPRCETCRRPLTFFVQLDLGALPAALDGAFGAGLLQLFYCVDCDGGWEPFSPTHRVRVVPPASGAPVAAPPAGAEVFPPRAIVGWEEFTDRPHPPEHPRLGLRYRYDFAAGEVRVTCPAVGLDATVPLDDDLAEAIGTAEAGDKLAGWPCWIQGEEYPTCPRCGATMRLVLQLDSEEHIPFMFGDTGIGHITQCPDHRDVVAFGWACF